MKAEQPAPPPNATTATTNLPVVPGSTSAGPAPVDDAPLFDFSKLTQSINYRVVGLVLLVGLLLGVWWYASRQTKLATSQIWFSYARPGQSMSDLEKAAQEGSRPARLEVARNLYGPQGVALLQPTDQDARNKGIANIQKARDEFVALADLFKSDVTLRASCLQEAAEAELTLVGIPKDSNSTDSLGSVQKAADLYKAAAETLGEKSTLAAEYRKRAEDLLADKARIEELGRAMMDRIAPPPSVNLGPKPGEGPKAPEGPLASPTVPSIPNPTPPTGGIAPPTGPLVPPVTPATGAPAPPSPAPAPPTTPPTTK